MNIAPAIAGIHARASAAAITGGRIRLLGNSTILADLPAIAEAAGAICRTQPAKGLALASGTVTSWAIIGASGATAFDGPASEIEIDRLGVIRGGEVTISSIEVDHG